MFALRLLLVLKRHVVGRRPEADLPLAEVQKGAHWWLGFGSLGFTRSNLLVCLPDCIQHMPTP